MLANPPKPSSKLSADTSVALWKKRFNDPSRKFFQALLLCGADADVLKATAEDCAEIALGSPLAHQPVFLRISPEKNAIKIDNIRQLIARLSLKPFQAPRIVVLIEDIDAMTDGAANALLKTLEEPSDTTVFLLTTQRPDEVIPTIRSRCQRINLPIPLETLTQNFETLYSSWESELSPLFAPSAKPFATASLLAESLSSQGDRLSDLFETLKVLWRDLSVLNTAHAEDVQQQTMIPQARQKLQKLAAKKPVDAVFEDMDLILETERAIEGNVNKTLALERLFSQLLS
jgi:DNA polymerase-3 subunit delta'